MSSPHDRVSVTWADFRAHFARVSAPRLAGGIAVDIAGEVPQVPRWARDLADALKAARQAQLIELACERALAQEDVEGTACEITSLALLGSELLYAVEALPSARRPPFEDRSRADLVAEGYRCWDISVDRERRLAEANVPIYKMAYGPEGDVAVKHWWVLRWAASLAGEVSAGLGAVRKRRTTMSDMLVRRSVDQALRAKDPEAFAIELVEALRIRGEAALEDMLNGYRVHP